MAGGQPAGQAVGAFKPTRDLHRRHRLRTTPPSQDGLRELALPQRRACGFVFRDERAQPEALEVEAHEESYEAAFAKYVDLLIAGQGILFHPEIIYRSTTRRTGVQVKPRLQWLRRCLLRRSSASPTTSRTVDGVLAPISRAFKTVAHPHLNTLPKARQTQRRRIANLAGGTCRVKAYRLCFGEGADPEIRKAANQARQNTEVRWAIVTRWWANRLIEFWNSIPV